jgi:hypothetical protein
MGLAGSPTGSSTGFFDEYSLGIVTGMKTGYPEDIVSRYCEGYLLKLWILASDILVASELENPADVSRIPAAIPAWAGLIG